MGQKLKLDFSGVETFQRCAEGVHTVKVASAELKQSSGGNDMIVVAFEVTKGTDKGAKVYENFPLVDKALWKLKSLLEAIGMKADGKVQLDVDKLVGKVCNINVTHEEYDGKLRARCESIMKFSAEDVDDDDEADEDDDEIMNEPEDEEEEEEKPSKKAKGGKKKADPEPEEDDDEDWDDDEDSEEEEKEEKKPAKKEKAPKKEKAAPAKGKKSKKEESEEEDDDWDDDDDDDWDED